MAKPLHSHDYGPTVLQASFLYLTSPTNWYSSFTDLFHPCHVHEESLL